MSKDLYNILGINKNSSHDEIKKAYKKLAIKWHPDKNPNNVEEATSKFKEITEAYEILSDDKKKQIYDQFGYDAATGSGGDMGGMGGFGNFGADVDIADLLGNMGGLGGMFGGPRRRKEEKSVINVRLNISLEEIFKGCTKKVKIPVQSKCKTCDGYGTKDKTSNNCEPCKGVGFVMKINRMGNMIQQQQVICSSCQGSGVRNRDSKSCDDCVGSGRVESELEKDIVIKPNFDHTTKFSMKDKGNYNTKLRTNDDIMIEVSITSKEYQVANKYDLYLEHDIDISDALSGVGHYVHHPTGKIYIESKDVIKDNDVRSIPNLGLPHGNNKFGHLIIKYKFIYPKALLPRTGETTDVDKSVKKVLSRKYEKEESNYESDDDAQYGRPKQQECHVQ